MNETRENHKIQQAAIRNLEIQLGQFANMMASRPQDEPPRKEKEEKEQPKVPIIDVEEQEKVKPYVPPIPFPQRLKKAQDDKSFLKFLDVFKKLQINIPFAEAALAQWPRYVNFLKRYPEQETKKFDDQGNVMLSRECSAIIPKQTAPKLKIFQEVSTLVTLVIFDFEKAFGRLGASINLYVL
ncbi:uncharacterized protein LOC105635422 [Jatropha curcas]|uniref:uncharacterized protein LOC105635422 n=1 Tax=Jatropha curcas TaxID=180498 RepID=UPI0018941F34|nr:uncharacterized protein LOC105635422 [Jatropha curcas]